jgi:hypothetical protein
MNRFIALLIFALAGCTGARATAPFKPGQRVMVEGGYRQGEEALDARSLLDGLEQVEASREDAQSARGWATAGSVLATPGGIALGAGVAYGLLAKDSSSRTAGWIVAGAGAVVSALGLGAAAIAGSKLRHATESYNAALEKEISTHSPMLPWIGAARDARGNWATVAGFRSAF